MNATNNFKPILFSTEMVQAILAGRKTQTRRILKNQPPDQTYKPIYYPGQRNDMRVYFRNRDGLNTPFTKFKYQIGDILWVRETFYEPLFEGLNGSYYYKADLEKQGWKFKWKPSLFMPKEAARIFLKVTNVRCERLQDISEEDAIAEGLEIVGTDREFIFYKNYQFQGEFHQVPRNSFLSLWDSINAKKHPWKSNPWVWVYDFERIEKPENFLS